MAVSYQLVIDCTSPEPLALFWAEALHYVIAPPPSGFDSWDDFFRSIGVPEDELGGGSDIIENPNGEGPRICSVSVIDGTTCRGGHTVQCARKPRYLPTDDYPAVWIALAPSVGTSYVTSPSMGTLSVLPMLRR